MLARCNPWTVSSPSNTLGGSVTGSSNLFAMLLSPLLPALLDPTTVFTLAREEMHSRSCARESRGELGGAGEDLFFGVILVERDLVWGSAQEHCIPRSPVLYRAEEDQFIFALFTREHDLLLGITLHEYTSFAPLGGVLMTLVGRLAA
jgi:hypothetical protein